MEAPLAIYEALLQAEVPVAAARDVAEKLEKDMNTALAVRQDIQQLDARVRHDIQQLDARVRHDIQQLDSRVQLLEEKLDSRFALIDERFISLEQRIVIKLGALMAVLMTLMVGAVGALAAILR